MPGDFEPIVLTGGDRENSTQNNSVENGSGSIDGLVSSKLRLRWGINKQVHMYT